MTKTEELFVVIARRRGQIEEVAVFSEYEAADRFCYQLDHRGDRDRVVLTSTYRDLPFTTDEQYED